MGIHGSCARNAILKPGRIAAGLGLAIVLTACESSGHAPREIAASARSITADGGQMTPYILEIGDPRGPRAVFQGVASWYGDYFHGRLTANGEVFDQHKLTAAHPTLPLPSLARVTRIDTGQSVLVRVNDRGPFVEGRVIDLSFAAAEALDFVDQGIAAVRIEALGPADPEDRAAPPMAFDPDQGPPRFDPQTRQSVLAVSGL